ncbi:MAG: hypothetical protein GY928_36605 [Colwellia sp.]|nr:hypothetical protein [Colwellia sp.]
MAIVILETVSQERQDDLFYWAMDRLQSDNLRSMLAELYLKSEEGVTALEMAYIYGGDTGQVYRSIFQLPKCGIKVEKRGPKYFLVGLDNEVESNLVFVAPKPQQVEMFQ